MYGAVLSSAAAENLGLHPYAAPTAANSVPYDGRPACNNCGFCAFFGCPIHAKGDPVAMLHARHGHRGTPSCWPRRSCRAVRTDGRRATGVDVIGPDGATRSIDARHVVIAAGAVETPRLLLLSGIDHPLVGRNFMVHFQTFVVGIFAERLHGHRGRAVTHVHDDAVIVDDAARAAAAEAGLPWIRGGLVEHGGPSLPGDGGQDLPVGGQAQVAHARLAACATACGPSPCRARISPSSPTGWTSTRPCATCGGSPWPASPTVPIATSSSPRRTTPPAWCACSRTWAPPGR